MSSRGRGETAARRPLSKVQAARVKSLVEADASDAEKVRRLRDELVESLQIANGAAAEVEAAKRRAEKAEEEAAKLRKIKSTLEKLCGELQQQNKRTLELSEKSRKAEELARKQSHEQMQAMIDDVQKKIEAQSGMEQKALTLQQELVSLAERNKVIEEHHGKQLEAKEIELRLAEAKAAQETHTLSQKLKEMTLRAQLQENLLEENKSLRGTLAQYKETLESISATSERSEKMYETLIKDMGLAKKNNVRLEQENEALKTKLSKALAAHKQDSKKSMDIMSKQSSQIDTLQGLCRGLKARLDDAQAAPAPPDS